MQVAWRSGRGETVMTKAANPEVGHQEGDTGQSIFVPPKSGLQNGWLTTHGWIRNVVRFK
jgi:hypothetical protein